MRVPLVDLTAQFAPLKDEVMAAIEGVLDSMHLFLGPNTAAFEDEWAAYCGTRACVAVGNGTDALHLALRAADVGPGDEVITVAHTFFATTEAIVLAGATPVYVDIEPDTYLINGEQIASRVTPRTKAIVPVHLYGQMADMDPIMDIAARHNLVVIEDAAQAHGAEYRGRRAGSIGHLGCFSFYYSKNLGAYGEAGAVVGSDPELMRRVRLLRDHGSEQRYYHQSIGFNSRMDEMQAAVLRIKLRHLAAWNAQRRGHAETYARLLAGSSLGLPRIGEDRTHVWYVYVVRSEDRDQLQRRLGEREIGTGIHFPVPVHLQPATRGLGYRAGDLPHTEKAAAEVLSIPMYAELTRAQLDWVASSIEQAQSASTLPVGERG
ncbi:MAG: DegT/DnrJ/EryC1/StrS family aminotransferase [Chloroflexi bacterium]|nr:DegT/DnrJ/EryC1/StrS family aminotransferase [Chloroflexota bacterium]MBV9600761.1 DegT/DnrJ/EryC1/StrS family aminotransferase [Chloroflexota bacterium]